jgi:hypothetical protein
MLFTYFPNLQELSIWFSKLREIHPNTFQNAKKLENLFFGYNEFKYLNASTFAGATLLRTLGVSEPNLTININAFRGVTANNGKFKFLNDLRKLKIFYSELIAIF